MVITTITNAIVTAYCACTTCCGDQAASITASGVKPISGVTIAASRTLPIGTKVIINNHTYVVQDRLARRYDSRFDIYFDSHQDAKKFGKQTLNVKIIQ